MEFRDNDDDLYTNKDLNKSIDTIQRQVDILVSKFGQLFKIPISSDSRNTIMNLIIKVGQLDKLQYEKNKRQLENSIPKKMKWS